MRRHQIFSFALLTIAAACGTVAFAGGRGGGGRGGRGADPADARNGPRGPAPTLTAPATPTTKPDDRGFMHRWLLLEPMPASGVAESAFRPLATKEHFPDEFKMIPQDGQKVAADAGELTWHAVESDLYSVNLYHFSWALNKPTNNAFWLAFTVIQAPEEIKDVRLAVGSNDASIWWLNGEELIGIFDNRMDIPDDGVSKKITLKKGPNILRAAVCNEMGPTEFCARFLDANDEPVKNLTISLTTEPK